MATDMIKLGGRGLQQHGFAFHTGWSTSRCAVGWLDSDGSRQRYMMRVVRRDVGFALWPNPFGPVSTRRSPRRVFAAQRRSRVAQDKARFNAWMSAVSCCNLVITSTCSQLSTTRTFLLRPMLFSRPVPNPHATHAVFRDLPPPPAVFARWRLSVGTLMCVHALIAGVVSHKFPHDLRVFQFVTSQNT